MNRYEKDFLRPLTFIKVLFALSFLGNLFIPIYTPYSLLCGWAYQVPILLFLIWGLLGGLGYCKSTTPPLFQLALIRTLQGILNKVSSSDQKLVWGLFILVIVLDIIFCVFLLYFHNNYKFEEE